MGVQWRQHALRRDQPSRAGSMPRLLDTNHSETLPVEWFAVHVRAGREQSTAGHLRGRGYEVFCPTYRERRRWSDRIRTAERALFAGYVFCRITTAAHWKVVTAPGVIRIVGDRSGPLPVSASEIAAIQRIVELQHAVEPWPFLQAGRPVRVECGPLRGTEGVVLRAKDRHRLIVSVSLLQRSVAVEIDPAWVIGLDSVADLLSGIRAE
jgi:transcription antitermination factor NusG